MVLNLRSNVYQPLADNITPTILYTIKVFFMNDLTANKTQVMCPGLGHIWLRHLHPNYIAQIKFFFIENFQNSYQTNYT